MKLQIMAIRDNAAGAFMRPFFAMSTGAARREFGDIANDSQHAIGKHPEDYCLYHLGEFNEINGDFEISATPESLGLASSYVKEVQK
jgi:hypothetical protein